MDHAPSPSPPPPPSPASGHPHADPRWEMFHEARSAPGARSAADRAWAEDYEEVE